MKYQLPQLPWQKNELAPALSADAIETHYSGHHKAYVDKLNSMIESENLGDITLEEIIMKREGGIFNQAAQAWNHTFYWLGLSPKSRPVDGKSELGRAIETQFGGLDGLKNKFMDSAKALFGSGWTWLVADPQGKLEIVNTGNAENPMRGGKFVPLWTCDIWEHAYYIDYRNKRPAYLEAVWDKVNWEFAQENMAAKKAANMTHLMKA